MKLTTTTSAFSYLWTGPNSYSSVLQNSTITEVDDNIAGVYTLTVSNSFGCNTQDTVSVFIVCEDTTEFYIPNVFTPNGDSKNQIFKVTIPNLKEIQVDIYNRWGVMVYSWNSPEGGWDGKTQGGSESPSGTYYYLIKATTLQGKTIAENGFISLFR